MSCDTMLEQAPLAGTAGTSVHNAHDRRTRYGLPCANCRIYYAAELTSCPVCQCKERVSPTLTFVRSAVRL
jgi:hypothetical protein